MGVEFDRLPREALYWLQDWVIIELHAREGRALQVLCEQKTNLEQLSLQCDNLVTQNQGLEQAMEEAYSSILELVVTATLPTTENIHQLETGVHKTQEEATKVQLELNVQIAELRLKAQPSTPPKVREKCHHTIQLGLEVIEHTVQDCMRLLDQSLFMLTSLDEDPTLQQLETEAQELQQAYDTIRGIAQMVALTQWLAKMREAQALKAQVDTSCQKEEVLKECIQPWLEESFTITAVIERKLAQMHDTYVQRQEGTSDNNASDIHARLIQWIVEECVADVFEAGKLLDGL